MSSGIVGLLVLSAFHLSSSYNLFVFFKLARKTLADSEPDVPVFVPLLAALVMFVAELLPPKGAVTRFLSTLHTRCKSVLPSFSCFLAITAYYVLVQDAPDGLGPSYGVFVISMASFLALHAPKEVSCIVSDSLLPILVIFATRDYWTGIFLLWKGGDLTIVLASCIANGIGVWLTLAVRVKRLGGLRYPDKEPDVISDMVLDKASNESEAGRWARGMKPLKFSEISVAYTPSAVAGFMSQVMDRSVSFDLIANNIDSWCYLCNRDA